MDSKNICKCLSVNTDGDAVAEAVVYGKLWRMSSKQRYMMNRADALIVALCDHRTADGTEDGKRWAVVAWNTPEHRAQGRRNRVVGFLGSEQQALMNSLMGAKLDGFRPKRQLRFNRGTGGYVIVVSDAEGRKVPEGLFYKLLPAEYRPAQCRGTESGGRTLAPHLRRGHWHRYWVGPKSDPSLRKLVERWVDPVLVNA